MLEYSALIKETAEELQKLGKRQSNGFCRDRVRFLYLLKSGQASSQALAGKQLGLEVRQSQRLWRMYRQKGLAVMLDNPYKGYKGRLDENTKEKVLERLKEDDIATLTQAQKMMAKEFGLSYSLPGLSYLFGQMKVKLKTGRPSNVRKDPKAVAKFEKNFPGT